MYISFFVYYKITPSKGNAVHITKNNSIYDSYVVRFEIINNIFLKSFVNSSIESERKETMEVNSYCDYACTR